jgi:hypothetical protein
MTATIDGTPWAATSLSITQGSGIVVIQAQGALSGGNALISLVMPSSAGTYTLGLVPGVTGAQGATLSVGGALLWSADTTNGNGSLTLSSLSATHPRRVRRAIAVTIWRLRAPGPTAVGRDRLARVPVESSPA